MSAACRHDEVAFTAAMEPKVVRGTMIGAGWLLGEVPRSYVSMGIWYFAALVAVNTATWPEPVSREPRGIRVAPAERRSRWWTRRSS